MNAKKAKALRKQIYEGSGIEPKQRAYVRTIKGHVRLSDPLRRRYQSEKEKG